MDSAFDNNRAAILIDKASITTEQTNTLERKKERKKDTKITRERIKENTKRKKERKEERHRNKRKLKERKIVKYKIT